MKKITLFEKSISQNDKFAVEDFLDNFLDRAGDNKLKVGSTIDMSDWKNIYDEDHVRDYLNTMDISFKDDVIAIEGFKKVNESEESDKISKSSNEIKSHLDFITNIIKNMSDDISVNVKDTYVKKFQAIESDLAKIVENIKK